MMLTVNKLVFLQINVNMILWDSFIKPKTAAYIHSTLKTIKSRSLVIQSRCLSNLFMTKIAAVTGLGLTDTLLMPAMKRNPGLAHRRENHVFVWGSYLKTHHTNPHTHRRTYTRTLLELLNHQSVCVCDGGRVSLWQVEDCGESATEQQCFPTPTSLLKLLVLFYPFTFPLPLTFGSRLLRNDLFSTVEPISILSAQWHVNLCVHFSK